MNETINNHFGTTSLKIRVDVIGSNFTVLPAGNLISVLFQSFDTPIQFQLQTVFSLLKSFLLSQSSYKQITEEEVYLPT